MSEFEQTYNRVFRGRHVDTKLMADCEALWDAGVAAERSRIASLLRQRGAEELARMVEGGE